MFILLLLCFVMERRVSHIGGKHPTPDYLPQTVSQPLTVAHVQSLSYCPRKELVSCFRTYYTQIYMHMNICTIQYHKYFSHIVSYVFCIANFLNSLLFCNFLLESGHGLYFLVFDKPKSKCRPRPSLSSKGTGMGRLCLHAVQLFVFQFLGVVGLRVLVPTWLLITTGFLPQQKFAPWKYMSQEAHQVGQQDRNHGVLQPSHWHGNQYVFYSLVAGHYLQGPGHIQEEGTVQRYKCMEGSVAGGHFRKLLAIISISIYCKYMAVHEHLPVTDGNTNRIKKVDAWLY